MNHSVVEEELEAPPTAPSPASYLRELLGAARAEPAPRPEQLLAAVESFNELMKCFMCLSKVREPVLCPGCSKFACELCLRSWIIDRKPECPVCRRPLSLAQLVKVRFLGEFSRAVELLGRPDSPGARPPVEAELCEEHGSAMSYYCLTCYKSVCSDCVVITKRHDGHSLERIRVVYERKLEAVCGELANVGRRAAEQRGYACELSAQLDQLRRAKEEKIDELMNAYRLMKTRLDNDFALRAQQLGEEKRRTEEGVAGCEAVTGEILAQIKADSPARTIARVCEYLKTLSELALKSPAPALPSRIVADFGLEVSVRAAEGHFLLRDYARRRAANDIVFSEPLVADGITWRVKVYPNGTGIYKGMYLSLFVEMVRGWEGGGSFYYKVVLVKPRNEAESIERDYTSEFENSICWGYNRFCKLEDLEAHGFLEQDQLALRFFVKPANHFQKLRDQAHHVAQLEEQLRRERELRERETQSANPFLRGEREEDGSRPATLTDLTGSLNLNALFASESEQSPRAPSAERLAPHEECRNGETGDPLQSKENSLIKISDGNEDSPPEEPSGPDEE